MKLKTMRLRTFDFSKFGKFSKLKSKPLKFGTLNQDLLKWRTYLIALWITITIYSLSAFFSGNRGLAAYNELGEELRRQEANITTLRRINSELGDMKDALLYDEETIALYARELGYGREDETFIRIVGLDKKMKVRIDPGELIPVIKHAHNPDLVLKIIACSIGLGVLFLMELAGQLNRRP